MHFQIQSRLPRELTSGLSSPLFPAHVGPGKRGTTGCSSITCNAASHSIHPQQATPHPSVGRRLMTQALPQPPLCIWKRLQSLHIEYILNIYNNRVGERKKRQQTAYSNIAWRQMRKLKEKKVATWDAVLPLFHKSEVFQSFESLTLATKVGNLYITTSSVRWLL